MRRLPACCLFLLLALLATGQEQAIREALVTDSGLRVRSGPDLESGVLFHLDRGDVVQVLERSPRPMQIGELREHWYRVRRGDRSGWTFGAYLAFDKLANPEIDITVFWYEDREDARLRRYHIISQSRDIHREEEIYGATVRFSASLRYYAVMSLQDIVGGMTIHETLTGEMLHRDKILSPLPVWDGQRMSFRSVVEQRPETLRWRRLVFEGGVVSETDQEGRLRY